MMMRTRMTGQALHRCALALTFLCICILPATNVRLPWSAQPFSAWLAGAAWVCWVVSRVLTRRTPHACETSAWWGAACVCMLGWLMTIFPSALVERDTGVILELDKPAWQAFGTIDQGISIQSMISIMVALVLLLMSFDFATERSGRVALAFAVMIAGSTAAISGLIWRNGTELESLWKVPHVPDSVFGLFWYHGNAAAFLNLCWPMVLWLCVTLLQRGAHGVGRQLMLACLVLALLAQIIAVFVNVSKMGHLMVILEMTLLVASTLVIWRRNAELSFNRGSLLALVFAGIAVLALCAWLAGAGEGFGRWNIFASRHFDDPARRHALLMALRIGAEHAWTGTGPGTFEWMAAHYSTLDPVLAGGRWRHAHNDFAEFFAEWGVPGALLMLVAGGWFGKQVMHALRLVFSATPAMSFQRRSGLLCCFSAVTVTLVHAFVDFPLQIDATRHLSAVMLGLLLALASAPRRGAFRFSE